jgi:hypothetical protein
MSAIPPTAPPTMEPIGVLDVLCEPIVGRVVDEDEGDERSCVCVGPFVLDVVPNAIEVSIPPMAMVSVTGAVSVIEVMPLPVRMTEAPDDVVGRSSTNRL